MRVSVLLLATFVAPIALAWAGDLPDVDDSLALTEQAVSYACDNAILRYHDLWAEAYGYTPAQRDLIRARFQELKAQQVQHTLATAERRAQLAAQAAEHRRRWRAGQTEQPYNPIIEQQFQELRQGNVVFNARLAQTEVERFLTVEQIARGRRFMEDREREFLRKISSAHELDALEWMQALRRSGRSVDGWYNFMVEFGLFYRLSDHQRSTTASIYREASEARDHLLAVHDLSLGDLLKQRRGRRFPVPTTSPADRPLQLDERVLTEMSRIWNQYRDRLDNIPMPEQYAEADQRAQKTLKQAGVSFAATRPSDYIATAGFYPSMKSPGIPISQPAATQPAEPSTQAAP